MLLEFRINNYRSFKDELVFSMVPAPKQKDLEYSVLKKDIGNKRYKALCSAVIYGPNAAGKSNIISAMDTFKKILQRGNIKNPEDTSMAYVNPAAVYMELIPFMKNEEAVPTVLGIKFVAENLLIDYSFGVNFGKFMEPEYEREIEEERLCVNDKEVFSRKKTNGQNALTLDTEGLNEISEYLNDKVKENFTSLLSISHTSLNKTDLYLTGGFKTIIANAFVELVMKWINDKLVVIYKAESMSLLKKIPNCERDRAYVDERLNRAVKIFGISSNSIGYVYPDGKTPVLSSLFDMGDELATMPAEYFESFGTIRFVNEFPLVKNAILNGATLVVDEFDASLHPMALMNIINIFHNDEINKKNAQLIFNTHNPIFLDKNLYRRDEIKFVERDENTRASSLYALSDFKTYGSEGRNNADYMKNYFLDRYGAIKDIDFTDAFIEWIRADEEKRTKNAEK